MTRIAIILGASSGLGREAARQLDKRADVDEIWVLARRRQRLEAVARELNKPVCVVAADLKDEVAVRRFADEAKSAVQRGDRITWLVLASGFGRVNRVSEASLTENLEMIDLNVRALTHAASRLVPLVEGHTLMFASVAAFVSQPFFAVYAATKAYVLHLARALRVEYPGAGVTAVCPNPVETEFFNDFGGRADRIKRIGTERGEQVIRHAIRRAVRGKAMAVQSFRARLIYIGSRLLPHAWLHRGERLLGVYDPAEWC